MNAHTHTCATHACSHTCLLQTCALYPFFFACLSTHGVAPSHAWFHCSKVDMPSVAANLTAKLGYFDHLVTQPQMGGRMMDG